MSEPAAHTFGKQERIVSRKLIERLFGGGGSRSMSAFPLRLVYLPVEREGVGAKVLISVPKRHLKRAVHRNRVKRQVREAYRMHKQLLDGATGLMADRTLALAFIWLADELYDSKAVTACVKSLLERLNERLTRTDVNAHDKCL